MLIRSSRGVRPPVLTSATAPRTRYSKSNHVKFVQLKTSISPELLRGAQSFFLFVVLSCFGVAFQLISNDAMIKILECLYMEELCALLRTSSWFRSHASDALQRRKFVLPDVRQQKWRKSCSVISEEYLEEEERFFYRTNFDGRDEKTWCSGYVAAIIRHCKNVETIESGFLAKDRFLLKQSDSLHFKEFEKQVRW